jgi:hypothetical protein
MDRHRDDAKHGRGEHHHRNGAVSGKCSKKFGVAGMDEARLVKS